MTRLVLAYSGGARSSAALAWLTAHARADIVTVTVDLGQGGLLDVRDRALAAGAVRAHVLDRQHTFVRDYCLPALRADATVPVEGWSARATALAHGLIAHELVDIARLEGTSSVAHVAGDDEARVRLDASIVALDPALDIVDVEHQMSSSGGRGRSRSGRERRDADRSSPHAAREMTTLWSRSIESRAAAVSVPRSAAMSTDRSAVLALEFVEGLPVAINGVPMSLVELVSSLDTIAGAHGLGHLDRVEGAGSTLERRIVDDAPAAAALHAACHALRRLVTPRDLDSAASAIGTTSTQLARDGQWFGLARKALAAFEATIDAHVTGIVRARVSEGRLDVVGCDRSEPSDHVTRLSAPDRTPKPLSRRLRSIAGRSSGSRRQTSRGERRV